MTEPSTSVRPPPPRPRLAGEGLRLVRDAGLAALAIVAVGAFLVQPFRVEGRSMEPLLQPGERILVNKLAYRVSGVQRGDVVIVRAPDGRAMVKRVVGLPGETVGIDGGVVHVDGEPFPERYVEPLRRSFEDAPARRLAANEYFVLGDNRAVSVDSRRFGPIGRGAIRGRAALRYWPPPDAGTLPAAAD